ncbi:MAG: EutN/CcmL family microcompartment protein [Oscillospiraceae bacterium]|nr:EutN/CcmL family microcompartment protein [Oscillospiraceae bacterium]
MRVARVVGNVVSTIKDKGFYGHKLMIVEYLNEDGSTDAPREIVFDVADASIGDIVLVCIDGGASTMYLGEDSDGQGVIADSTICGVVDYTTFDGKYVAGNTTPQNA